MQLWKVHSNPLSSHVASPNDMSEAQTVGDSSTTTARTEDSDLNLAGAWPRGIWQRCNTTDWAVRTQIEPQTRQPRVVIGQTSSKRSTEPQTRQPRVVIGQTSSKRTANHKCTNTESGDRQTLRKDSTESTKNDASNQHEKVHCGRNSRNENHAEEICGILYEKFE